MADSLQLKMKPVPSRDDKKIQYFCRGNEFAHGPRLPNIGSLYRHSCLTIHFWITHQQEARLGETVRILVTGASGMLGRAICGSLRVEFPLASIFSIVRQNPLPKGVSSLTLTETTQMKFDLVVHAASPASPAYHTDALAVFDSNVRLTQQTLDSVEAGGVFVFISTGEVYGPNAKSGASERDNVDPQLVGPRSFYPLAKLVGESIATSRPDVRSVVFRTFHTFGPGLGRYDGRSFADFLWGAAIQKEVRLNSDGSSIRSYLHISDFSAAILKAVTDGRVSGILNVGSPDPVSVLDFAIRVSDISGARLVSSVPEFESHLPSPINALVPNVSKLEKLGWKRVRTFDDAIVDTLEWISAKGF